MSQYPQGYRGVSDHILLSHAKVVSRPLLRRRVLVPSIRVVVCVTRVVIVLLDPFLRQGLLGIFGVKFVQRVVVL